MDAERWTELAERARAGDESAWTELHQRFTPMLRWEAANCRLASADIDDVVQATWARCVAYLARIRAPQALPQWLRVVCRREAWNLVRQQRRCAPADELPAGSTPLMTTPAATDEVADQVARRETWTEVGGAIALLPDQQRDLLATLLALDGGERVYEQAARALSIPVGSIGPTRQRAIRRLRAELADRGSLIGGSVA
ncbi:MAG: RNA polymerase sigma factor [Nocardioides sp.]